MTEIIKEIYMENIDDPEHAMRTELNRDGLFELADNIKQNGLINPITVRPVHKVDDGRPCDPAFEAGQCTFGGHQFYEVVAGHRRLSACKIAGKSKIMCVVRELDDNQTFAVMAAENLERADVDPVDEALFIAKYIEQTKQTISEVAKVLRRSVGYVENRLALGLTPDYMQAYLKTGQLKIGVALALSQITDENTRRLWCEMAVRDGVSVAQADHWLYEWKLNQLPGGISSDVPPGGFISDAPQVIMFECAIDGKKYDARLFKSVMVYEGNLAMFNAVVAEIRKPVEPEQE